MPLNSYFVSELNTQGTQNEQMLLSDLTEEAIQIHGQMFMYVPRTLVAKDEILGEDRLSRFNDAYPLEMYIENPQGFIGQGEFIQKFGLYLEQSIQVSVSRRRWQEAVGRHGKTMLPNRPAEGDLLYSPLLKRLFEIKFVEKETNFWQLGHLPVWKMNIELFQYASENIQTGIEQIDVFESLKTFDTTKQPNVDGPDSFGDNNKFKEQAQTRVWDENNPFGEI